MLLAPDKRRLLEMRRDRAASGVVRMQARRASASRGRPSTSAFAFAEKRAKSSSRSISSQRAISTSALGHRSTMRMMCRRARRTRRPGAWKIAQQRAFGWATRQVPSKHSSWNQRTRSADRTTVANQAAFAEKLVNGNRVRPEGRVPVAGSETAIFPFVAVMPESYRLDLQGRFEGEGPAATVASRQARVDQVPVLQGIRERVWKLWQ